MPPLTLSLIEKVLNANMFNYNPPQTPQASSTGMTLIRPNLIPLLSSSILSQPKINGPQMILPQFILATEHPLRSAEYKPQKKNWFSPNLFWIIPNNYPSSLCQSHCDRKFSPNSILDLPVTTWENIKHCTACDFSFSVQAPKRTAPHGSKAVLTAYLIIYGVIGNKNFIFIGQWQPHSTSCTSTYGIQVQLFQIIKYAVIY